MDKKLKREIIRELRYLANTLYEMGSFKCDSIAKSLEIIADKLKEQTTK